MDPQEPLNGTFDFEGDDEDYAYEADKPRTDVLVLSSPAGNPQTNTGGLI